MGKEKRLSSRILAMFLSLCMIIQLVPAVSPQAQAGAVSEIKINFVDASITSLNAFNAYNQEKDASKIWYFDAMSSTGAFDAFYTGSCVRSSAFSKDKTIVIKFYAQSGGTYMLTGQADKGGEAKVDVNGISSNVAFPTTANTGFDVGLVGVDAGWNTLTITGISNRQDVQLDAFTLKYVSAGKPFNLDFLAPITSGWGEAAFNEFVAYNQTYTEKTWRFLSSESNYTAAGAGAGNTIRFNLDAVNKWIAFDFEVPAEGYYIPQLGYQGSGAGGVTAKLAIDGKIIGEVNTTADSANNTKTFEKGIKLTAGTHKLVISRSSASGTYFCLRGLKFSPATEPQAQAAAEKKIIDFVDYGRSHANGDKYTDAKLSSYGWALSDDSSQAVLESGNTKIYKHVASGAVSSLLGLPSDGDTAVFDFNIPASSYYTVSVDAIKGGAECEVYIDGEKIGDLASLTENGVAEIGAANIKAGEHTIGFKKVGSAATLNIYSITFAPKTYGIGFAGLSGFADAELAVNGWELNEEESNSAPVAASSVYAATACGRIFIDKVGAEIAFDFEVPGSGYYDITAEIEKHTKGIVSNVYIDGVFVGTVDNRGEGGKAEASLRRVYIDERDVHTLVIEKLRGTAGAAAELRLYSVSFDKAGSEIGQAGEKVIDFVEYAMANENGEKYVDASVEKWGWEVNHKASNNTVTSSGNTRVYNDSNVYRGLVGLRYYGDRFALDFDVPGSGMYDISMVLERETGTVVKANIYADGQFVGIISTEGAAGSCQLDIGSVNLQGIGPHTFVLEKIGAVDNENTRLVLEKIIFTPTAEPTSRIISFTDAAEDGIVSLSGVNKDKYGWSLDNEETSATTSEIINESAYFALAQPGDKASFNFDIEVAGYYNAYTAIKGSGDKGIIGDILVDGVKLGEADAVNTSGAHAVALEGIWLDAGEHTVSAVKTAGAQDGGITIESFTFIPGEYAKTEVFDFLDVADTSDVLTSGNIEEHGWRVNSAVTTCSYGLYQPNATAIINLRNDGEAMAFDFTVSRGGEYKVQTRNECNGEAGVIADVYVNEQKIGTVDTYGRTGIEFTKLSAAKLKGDGEINTLKLVRTGGGTSGARLQLGNFVFVPCAAAMVDSVEPIFDSSVLTVGESTAVRAAMHMTDGTYSEADGIGDVYIEDDSVAVYENGVLTAVSAGETSVYISAIIDGRSYTGSKKITVISQQEIDGNKALELFADKPLPLGVKETRDILIQGAVSNMVVNMGRASDMSVSNNTGAAIVDADVYVDNTGEMYLEVTGLKGGNAVVTVSVTVDGLSDDVEIPITVEKDASAPKPHVIEFAPYGTTTWQDVSIDVYNNQLNKEKTTASILANENTKFSGSSFCLQMDNKDDIAVFDFNVPEDGIYDIEFAGRHVENYGIVAAFYIDGEFAGDFNYNDPDGEDESWDEIISFKSMNLTKGKHEFKAVRVDEAKPFRHYRMWLNNISFTKIAEPAEVVGIKAYYEKDKLTLGMSEPVSFGLRMSDGKDYTFYDYAPGEGKMDVQVRTPERISYNGSVMTGKKTGTGIFAIEAQRDEDEMPISASWQIDVTGGQFYDFRREAESAPSTAIISKDLWCVDTEKTSGEIAGDASFVLNRDGMNARLDSGDEIALKLMVQQDGIYDMDVTGLQLGDAGMRAAFYLDEIFMGEFDFADASAQAGVSVTGGEATVMFNAVSLTKGEHTLYIKRVNQAEGSQLKLGSIVFARAINQEEMPEFSAICIQTPEKQFKFWETMQTRTTVWMTNNRPYRIGLKRDGSVDEKNKFALSSSNEEIFTVDETGLLTGSNDKTKVGKAKLIANATVNGVDHSAEETVETIRVLKLIFQDTIYVDRKASESMKITAVLDNGDEAKLVPDEGSAVTVSPYDEGRTEGFAVISEGGVEIQVTGLRAGNTGVVVEATMDGVTGSVVVPVMVLATTEGERSIDIDFSNPLLSYTPFTAELESFGWKINMDESSETVSDATIGLTGRLSATIFRWEDILDGRLVIDFMVYDGGYYSAELIGDQSGNYGADVDIYIDDEYVGEFNFSHPSDSDNANVKNEGVKATLNSIYMERGVHKITLIRRNGRVGRHGQTPMQGIYFDRVDHDVKFKELLAGVDKDTICVGESARLTAKVIMYDDSVRNFGPLKDESNDERNKLDVTVVSGDEYIAVSDGVITALGSGRATIAVSAVVNGVSTPVKTVDITVTEEKLGSVEAIFESDLYVGKEVVVNVHGKTDATESEINSDNLIIEVDGSASADKIEIIAPDILNPTWRVKGIAAGPAELTVKARIGETGEVKTYTLYFDVLEDGLVGINVTAMPRYIRPDSRGTQIKVSGGSWKGEKLDISQAEITYSYADAEGAKYVTLDPTTGWVTPTGELGYADIAVHVEMPGFTDEAVIRIVVTNGKTGRSYYTDEEIANARENISKYAWARKEMEAAVADAEKYLDKNELLWSMVTPNELPRSASVGYAYDPNASTCRYCGIDFNKEYGKANAWEIDVFNTPWKVKCPNCRRLFPSNNFGEFYKLGIDENGGDWSYELAHLNHFNLFKEQYKAAGVESYEEHKKMRDAGETLPEVGYLKNDSYPEKDEHIDKTTGELVNQGIHGWGVDDGFGYKPPNGKEFFDGYAQIYVKEHHSYIAYYNMDIMTNVRFMLKALPSLGNAYMYTGEAKYGRAGAILLDRLADVYADMNVDHLWPTFNCSTNSMALGKLQNPIHECGNSLEFAKAYDALYPAFDDPYVIDFLSKKAKQYNMENTKETAELIRKNCEDGILRAIFAGVKNGDIYGNFGTHQMSLTTAAVVLDDYEDTKEMLVYLMAPDESGWHRDGHTGGELIERLVNDLDRDGGTAEGLTANYANLRCNSLASVADALQGYTRYEDDPDVEITSLYDNPIYQRMLEAQIELTMCRRTTLNSGDSGTTAGLSILLPGIDTVIRGYQATGSIQLAQMLYFMNGNKTDGLCADIFSKDPENIAEDVRKVIDEHGEYPFDDSILLAGLGFTALRDGSLYNAGNNDEYDNQRAFTMSFALTGNHGHHDALNLGIFAYGLDFAPDLGYPTTGSALDEDRYWSMNTISHNTIGVNDVRQGPKSLGKPLHFDDAGMVKLIDAETPNVYSFTDEFRRTVVMVKVDDDVSYGVDFFRVKGGDEHLFSFHAQTDEEPEEYNGFTVGKRRKGSYAGETVEHRTEGYFNGYSYLYNVRTAEADAVADAQAALDGDIWMNFHIKDFRNAIKDNKNLYLRMTMLNDFDLSEISFAKGDSPKRGNNPDSLGYVLARRSGKDLDSTFTTVYEPYKNERYLSKVERITDIVRSDGKPIDDKGDVVAVVRAEHVNGRVDYILYATNNKAEYVISDVENNVKLEFNGFVGMCSVVDGKVTYNYVNDGTKLDIELVDDEHVGAVLELEQNEYTGEVVDFTRTIEYKNLVKVHFNELEKLNVEELAGRHIYIENDGIGNGVYLIEGAEENVEDNTVVLDIGDRRLVRSAENENGKVTGFKYNIASGQYFSIPLSAGVDMSPVFNSGNDMSATAGKKFSHTVIASSELGTVTYSGTALPRGASVDSTTGEISWTPDSTQVGDHHFAIEAMAGGVSSTLHFIVSVYKAAGSVSDIGSDSISGNEGNTGSSMDSGSSSGVSSGGGGGAGGGSSDTSEDNKTEDDTGDENTGDVGDGVLDVPSEKFVDLGNHTWAKDAIYSLVEKGVVNGTSANTYSPANNIKRADFAIMLVRAFGVTEGETEHFADVDTNKYYAEELRLAKANGIVGGIGDNKFNPEGEITRQDMMLMLTRALDAVGYELSEVDHGVLAQFADAASISDYACDAVSRVVKDGIIGGSNGRINPLSKATRAEIAVMLERVIAK